MIFREQTLGVVLAGGLSRRMGGGDKCLLELGGEPILAHVIRALQPQCAQMVLNANGDSGRFAVFGLEVVADTIPGNPGPLGGVLAGLEWAGDNACKFTHIVTAAADTPFLPLDLVESLHAAANRAEKPIALASTREGGQFRDHPVIGLWPVRLAANLRRAIEDHGIRKVLDWTDAHGWARAEFDISDRDPFFNVNTPADLNQSAQMFAESA